MSNQSPVSRIRQAAADRMPWSISPTVMAASSRPRQRLPTSPMKMRAGGQLKVRKPSVPPAVTHSRSPNQPGAPPLRNWTARQKNRQAEPARPSMPSMKLKRLVCQTASTSATANITSGQLGASAQSASAAARQ